MESAKLHPFELFPRLPQEIRTEIWKIVALQPRDIFVNFSFRLRTAANQTEPFVLRTPTSVAPILHVCREARLEGLKVYYKCFRKLAGSFWSKGKRAIYFNEESDRLFVQFPPLNRIILNSLTSFLASSDEQSHSPLNHRSSASAPTRSVIALYTRDTSTEFGIALVIQPLARNRTLEQAQVEISQWAAERNYVDFQIITDWKQPGTNRIGSKKIDTILSVLQNYPLP